MVYKTNNAGRIRINRKLDVIKSNENVSNIHARCEIKYSIKIFWKQNMFLFYERRILREKKSLTLINYTLTHGGNFAIITLPTVKQTKSIMEEDTS